MESMEQTLEVIEYLKNSKKKTPVKVYYKGSVQGAASEDIKVFDYAGGGVIFGDWAAVKVLLEANKASIEYYEIENDRRNSAVPLLNMLEINARIEPGAIIREKVTIGDNAIIMMGANINIGCSIGEGTMIDLNATLGGRVQVGKMCHVGAGAVLAGVIEPPSAKPVVIEDNVLIGANAVILEGVRVGTGAVVAAGAIVVDDVPPNTVVAGIPAKVIKEVDEKTKSKTGIVEGLRSLK